MIRGSTLHSPDMRALVADLRATIEEFEDPRDEASALQPGSAEPDKDIQRDMARRRLRPTVAYAAEHLPYYRDWFPENDVDPRAITLESFASIPLTSMSLLMVTGCRSRHTVLSTDQLKGDARQAQRPDRAIDDRRWVPGHRDDPPFDRCRSAGDTNASAHQRSAHQSPDHYSSYLGSLIQHVEDVGTAGSRWPPGFNDVNGAR